MDTEQSSKASGGLFGAFCCSEDRGTSSRCGVQSENRSPPARAASVPHTSQGGVFDLGARADNSHTTTATDYPQSNRPGNDEPSISSLTTDPGLMKEAALAAKARRQRVHSAVRQAILRSGVSGTAQVHTAAASALEASL